MAVIVVAPVFPHQGQVLFPVPAGMPPKLIQSPSVTPVPVALFDIVTVTVDPVVTEETVVPDGITPTFDTSMIGRPALIAAVAVLLENFSVLLPDAVAAFVGMPSVTNARAPVLNALAADKLAMLVPKCSALLVVGVALPAVFWIPP